MNDGRPTPRKQGPGWPLRILVAGIGVIMLGIGVATAIEGGAAAARSTGWTGASGDLLVADCYSVFTGRSSHSVCEGTFQPRGSSQILPGHVDDVTVRPLTVVRGRRSGDGTVSPLGTRRALTGLSTVALGVFVGLIGLGLLMMTLLRRDSRVWQGSARRRNRILIVVLLTPLALAIVFGVVGSG